MACEPEPGGAGDQHSGEERERVVDYQQEDRYDACRNGDPRPPGAGQPSKEVAQSNPPSTAAAG